MQYRAKVLNRSMSVEFIDVDAANEAEARRYVETSGSRLLAIQQQSAVLRGIKRRSRLNLLVFNQQLNSLLEAGQPIVDAIEILGRNDRSGQHQAVYEALLLGLKQGMQLSEAMSGLPSVFPPLYVAMIRSSETTGSLRAAIKRYMQYQTQLDSVRSKLVSAAIYPSILVSVGFVVVAFLLLYVVPRFSAVFDDVGSKQTQAAGFVLWWGGLVRDHGNVVVALMIGLPLAVVAVLGHAKTRVWFYRRLVAAPWVGDKIWIFQLARLYRTLSMLLRSGVSVLAAMKMTEASLPAAMREDMRAASLAISEGRSISVVMQQHNLSSEVARRLLVAGESSGNLDEMMARIADFYDQEVATWVDIVGRLIEPALMVGIGLVIGGIVLMLYLPIFDLASAIH